MTTTFYLPKISAASARLLFGSWRCRIERMDDKSCNIVFFDQEEWNRFELHCEEHDIEMDLV